MLSGFWQRSRARQRRILSEVGQIELAVERENPQFSPVVMALEPQRVECSILWNGFNGGERDDCEYNSPA